MESIYRFIASRGPARRRARALFLITIAFAIPSLAATMGLAAGEPTVVSAKTLDDGNGKIDKVQVIFNLTMNTGLTPKISSGPGSPGFRVEGYTITGFAWSGSQTLDISLAEKATPDTGVTPKLSYEGPDGNAKSALGAELATEDDLGVADGAGPVMMSFTGREKGLPADPGLFSHRDEEAIITFSEPTKIAGAAPFDRWSNLERAVKFVNKPAEGGTCPVDGNGAIIDFNFPQPNTATSPEIFLENQPPVNGFSAAFHIKMKTGHLGSTKRFGIIPDGCRVGVDPSNANRSVLTDAAANIAKGMDVPAGSPQELRLQPMDMEPVSISTRDLRGGGPALDQPDGHLDAIKLSFPQAIDTTTIDQVYSVTLDGAPATVTSKEIGASAEQLILHLNAPTAWHSGVLPTISYTKPSNCTANSGDGLKIDLGGEWRACVASFSSAATDGAGPMVLDSQTVDGDLDGSLDRVRVWLSEAAIAISGPGGWKVDGVAATVVAVDPADASILNVDFPESATPNTGAKPAVEYIRLAQAPGQAVGTQDGGGNQVLDHNAPAKKDGAAPRIASVTQYDVNGDGNVDRALLEYSEPIVDPAAAAGANFTIGGTAASITSSPTGTADPGVANDEFLLLAVTGLTGSDPKEVVYTPGSSVIKDAANNTVIGQTIEADAVVDLAEPRGTMVVSPSAPMSAGTSTVSVSFTEPMDPAFVPAVSFVTENGSKTLTPVGWNDEQTAWSGTVEIVESDCSVSTGCPVTVSASGAKDPAGNAQAAAATLNTEIDTVAPSAPTVGAYSATLAPGGTTPADVINMFVTDFSLGGTIAAGEASPGVARILLDGEPMAGAEDATISASDTTVSPATSFGSAAALQDAIAEGPVALSLQLCDDAGNCVESATDRAVTVDYTPVAVALTAPSGGEVVAYDSTLNLVWDGDATATDFDHIVLAYSTNAGSSWTTIAADVTDADGTYAWTTPFVHTTQARARVTSVDVNGNTLSSSSGNFTIEIPESFADVPRSYWAFLDIEKLYAAGVTGGCRQTPLEYCPSGSVTRGQMAVFLLRAMGHGDHLPAYRGLFSDVSASNPYALWIEHLADHGITSGCGGGKFCPGGKVTRGQMAVFMLNAMSHGDHLVAYKGTFSDVPSTHQFARHIEHLYEHEVTGGCAQSPLRFCPGRNVTRAQMAVFLVKAFDL